MPIKHGMLVKKEIILFVCLASIFLSERSKFLRSNVAKIVPVIHLTVAFLLESSDNSASSPKASPCLSSEIC
jgi:hypothetical protein